MIHFRRAVALIAVIGLAACATPNPALDSRDPSGLFSGSRTIDWAKVMRDAVVGMAMADATTQRPFGGSIGTNRDYTRTWTQTSSRGRCTFFGTGGSICR